ncbi:MAG: metal-dependent hydrolase [Pseudomonadales bacterium]|nr:metal-dependent hydrolase [Pseudomonadales bacterium]
MNNRVEIDQTNVAVSHLEGYSLTPLDHTLVPRVAKFEFDGSSIPRFWQGEVFATRMFDAMQLAFPDGERMFIHAVRNYADKVTDPVLKEQVKHFIFQEAQHGMAHTDFTETLTKQGLKVKGVVKFIKKGMLLFQDKAPHKYQLASTVAAEHLTASLGEFMLSTENNLLSNADPKMKAFYMWHGIEEVEHKAVAFDVYQQVAGGGYFTRSLALALMYPMAIFPLMAGTMAMMHVDGELSIKELRKGVIAMFGKQGIWRKTFPAVMSFYNPSFHPWQTGYPKGFHEWKKAYEETNGDMEAAMYAAESAVSG